MTVEAQNHGDFGGKVDNFEDFKIGSVGRYKNAVGVDGNSEFLVLTCGCKEGDRWMVGIGDAVGKFSWWWWALEPKIVPMLGKRGVLFGRQGLAEEQTTD